MRWREGRNDPRYNYRARHVVREQKELNVYNAYPARQPVMTGSELCTLFLDPHHRRNATCGNAICRMNALNLCLWRSSRQVVKIKVVAEMRAFKGDSVTNTAIQSFQQAKPR